MSGERLERAGLLLAVLLAAGLAWPLRHYVTDDTYIHLQYATHLAHGDGFVFNTGERVYGTTSPLWVVLLAEAIALGADGLLASKLLGGLATLAAVLLWWALARRTSTAASSLSGSSASTGRPLARYSYSLPGTIDR